MGNVRRQTPLSLPIPPLPNQPKQNSPDPLPNRPNHNHRPAKDAPLLRAQAEGQGHRRLLLRAAADPHPLAADRLLRRALRHHGPVRRLPRHHTGLRPQCPRRRPLHRPRHRPHPLPG